MAWFGKPTKLIDNIEVDLDREMRKTALRILRTLTLTTPVDTGRLVNNWLVGLGDPVTASLPDGLGDASRGAAFARGSRELTRLRFGQEIWISNNLPYAAIINDGDVNRPPRNMVEQALQEVSR